MLPRQILTESLHTSLLVVCGRWSSAELMESQRPLVEQMVQQGLVDLSLPLAPHGVPLVQSLLLQGATVPEWLLHLSQTVAPDSLVQAVGERPALHVLWEAWVSQRDKINKSAGRLPEAPSALLEAFRQAPSKEWEWLDVPGDTPGAGLWRAAATLSLSPAWRQLIQERFPLGQSTWQGLPVLWGWKSRFDKLPTSLLASLTSDDWHRPMDLAGVSLPFWQHFLSLAHQFRYDTPSKIEAHIAPHLSPSEKSQFDQWCVRHQQLPRTGRGSTGLIAKSLKDPGVDAWGIPVWLQVMRYREDLNDLWPRPLPEGQDVWGRPWAWHAQRLRSLPLHPVPVTSPPLLGWLYQHMPMPERTLGAFWGADDWVRVLARQPAWTDSQEPSEEMQHWTGRDEVARSRQLEGLMASWPRTREWLKKILASDPRYRTSPVPMMQKLPPSWRQALWTRSLLNKSHRESARNDQWEAFKMPPDDQAWDGAWLARHGRTIQRQLEPLRQADAWLKDLPLLCSLDRALVSLDLDQALASTPAASRRPRL